MHLFHKVLQDLVRSIAKKGDEVFVSETIPSAAFEVRVSSADYSDILYKLGVIKALALRFAGVPEEKKIFIHLIANAPDSLPNLHADQSNPHR